MRKISIEEVNIITDYEERITELKDLCVTESQKVVEVLKRATDGCRLSARNLEKLNFAELSAVTVDLFEGLYGCKLLLSKRLPEVLSGVSEDCARLSESVTFLRTNEILMSYDQNIQKAGDVIAKIEPVLDRINVLEQSCTELNQNHVLQMKELHDLKAALKAQPKALPPVLDYSKIKFPTPQPQIPAVTNIRKEVRKSSDELQRKNNVIVRGLKCEQGSTAYSVAVLFLENCEIANYNYLKSSLVSAHFLRNVAGQCTIRLVFRNQWTAEEVLKEAHKLKKGSQLYRQVYLSKDRTQSELEEHRKLVSELRAKIAEQSSKRWIIENGKIVEKGIFSRSADS